MSSADVQKYVARAPVKEVIILDERKQGTANPYLLLTGFWRPACTASRKACSPATRSTDDIGHLAADEFTRRGLQPLPRSAPEALDALESDAVKGGKSLSNSPEQVVAAADVTLPDASKSFPLASRRSCRLPVTA